MSTWCTTTFWNLKKIIFPHSHVGDELHFLTLLNAGGLLFMNLPALRFWTLLYYWFWKFRTPLYRCPQTFTLVGFHISHYLGSLLFICVHTPVQTKITIQISVLKVCHSCWSLELKSVLNARWNSALGQCDVLQSHIHRYYIEIEEIYICYTNWIFCISVSVYVQTQILLWVS